MKALVISGGGSKGAFAGDIAEYLIKEKNIKYDLFLGTSTGSLLIPLLSVDKVDKIKKVFTTVSQSDIFNTNPFKTYKDKAGNLKTKIHHLNTLKMFLNGRKTLGESENPRKIIFKSFKLNDFNSLKDSEKPLKWERRK